MNNRKHKSSITYKVMMMAAVSILVVTAVFLILYRNYMESYENDINTSGYGDIIVSLNEIDNILNKTAGNTAMNRVDENTNIIQIQASDKIQTMIAELQGKEEKKQEINSTYIIFFYAVTVISSIFIFGLVYIAVLRPFKQLEAFAGEIAAGNFDKELKYNRVHMFGEFTWAFDHMRHEIKKARACEQEAIENNKTVIATLSHDIKTPIASIRAYGEALSENMDSTPERRSRYINVIIKKCDEVTKITNDMFIHSLHNLDKLVIKKENVEIHNVIIESISAMEGNRTDIKRGNIQRAVIPNSDAGRIAQVIENIINNARKYAEGDIYVTTDISNDEYIVSIKDSGKGIPPEDMPFIFEKFYRGKNKGDKAGAGLGLFIVKYVMEQMDGRVELVNQADGLLVKLYYKLS